MSSGRVYLVGAGPGDPRLITVKGLELLHSCDVVLYDRLVPEELLREAPEAADRIFVGKRPGESHSRQVVADALMVSRARRGEIVVRLKGGDPFVFGRGGEEAALLHDAGVPFEIVPGVSSAIAVPGAAGIPVTQRGVAASFAVATVKEEEGAIARARLGRLATAADTLVLLMGVSALAEAAAALIEAGRPADTPAAVIEWGTTARQRTVVGTLATIADAAAAASIRPPATTVVGEVVNLRDALDWFERRPLFGRRVVITRPAGKEGRLAARLAELGAEVVALPAIEIAPPSSWEALDEAVERLAAGEYGWVLFASAAAVESVFARLEHAGRDARTFGGTAIAAVGDATGGALRARGLRPDLVPARYTGRDLARALGEGSDAVLFPRVEDGPPDVVEALVAAGWKVDEVAAYANVSAEVRHPGPFDAVAFTSASTVRSFVAAVPPSAMPGAAPVVCIGPSTEAAARAAGYAVAAVADPHTLDGLVDAVVRACGA